MGSNLAVNERWLWLKWSTVAYSGYFSRSSHLLHVDCVGTQQLRLQEVVIVPRHRRCFHRQWLLDSICSSGTGPPGIRSKEGSHYTWTWNELVNNLVHFIVIWHTTPLDVHIRSNELGMKMRKRSYLNSIGEFAARSALGMEPLKLLFWIDLQWTLCEWQSSEAKH